jgi:hypothetical protein
VAALACVEIQLLNNLSTDHLAFPSLRSMQSIVALPSVKLATCIRKPPRGQSLETVPELTCHGHGEI